jgi:sulfatase maturation enzyme AslB (radical SAM superfamily)
MADGRDNTLTLKQWKEGIDNLKELGCGFIAFYGAEPLLEFSGLPQVIEYAEIKGIHTTVITTGLVPDFERKLDYLYGHGLRSLSMSYDIVPLDKSSERKMFNTLNQLACWNTRSGIRDSAAIVTLTRTNYTKLVKTAKALSMFDIWTFFDFIHWDRGQPGSKCRNFDGIEDLKFKRNNLRSVVDEIACLHRYKSDRYKLKIHTSKPFLKMIQDDPELLIRYDWNCADHEVFPSWVTVDCDGLVYPCDDFQPRVVKRPYIYELAENWFIFESYWRKFVKEHCPGCLWNTHIDAHFIKAGELPFSDYVHI